MTDIVIIIYGLLLLSGAYFGIKVGSRVSLIMGLISGAIVFLGFSITKSNPALGFQILTAVSGLLCLVFAKRLCAKKKFMPAGMLLIASLVACVVSVLQIL